jgi:hypothetical protein
LWLIDCEHDWDSIYAVGLRESGPLYPLEHNQRRGIIYMEPTELLSSYDLKGKGKRVVVDATFNGKFYSP